jgi:hypothetical protein
MEHLIGTVRRECLDRMLIFGEAGAPSSTDGRALASRIKGLIEEAARAGQALTLGVEKTNPALRLYERLGFRTTHEDDRKFYMQHDWRVPH